MVVAPRATTSFKFDLVLFEISGFEINATTGVPSSIKAIVPCFNSPAANPSV